MTRRIRPGRPPRIDIDVVAGAALAIGLEHATMHNVAERVGVSPQALYQHVAGRDELLRLAGRHALAQMRHVEDRGQHWAEFLRELADAVRDVLTDNPQLVALNLAGLVNDQEILLRSGTAIEALCRRGLTPDHAVAASGAVLAVALASAIDDVREACFEADGKPWPTRVFTAIAAEPSGYPVMSALAQSGYRPGTDTRYAERLKLVLSGIATEYNLELGGDA